MLFNIGKICIIVTVGSITHTSRRRVTLARAARAARYDHAHMAAQLNDHSSGDGKLGIGRRD